MLEGWLTVILKAMLFSDLINKDSTGRQYIKVTRVNLQDLSLIHIQMCIRDSDYSDAVFVVSMGCSC